MGQHGVVIEADDVNSVGVGGGGRGIGIDIVDDVGRQGSDVGGAVHAAGTTIRAIGGKWRTVRRNVISYIGNSEVTNRCETKFIRAFVGSTAVGVAKAEGDTFIGVGPVAKAGGDVAKVVGVESASVG